MRRTGGWASGSWGRSWAKPDGSASRQGLGRDVLTRVPSAYGPAVDRLCLRRNSLLRLCERAVRRRGDFRWFEHPQEHRHASPEEACRREEVGEDWDGKKPEPEIPSAVAAGSRNGANRASGPPRTFVVEKQDPLPIIARLAKRSEESRGQSAFGPTSKRGACFPAVPHLAANRIAGYRAPNIKHNESFPLSD